MNKKAVKYFIIGTFVTLYLMVSVISTIHVIDFFSLSNPSWLAVSLAIAFEIGAAASLASIITLDKMNKGIVWSLFIILTLMQAMGNSYYAYSHLNNFQGWVELFGLTEDDLIYQKRILSIISGAILPIVALGFIKSLVDYIKPTEIVTEHSETPNSIEINDTPHQTFELTDELANFSTEDELVLNESEDLQEVADEIDLIESEDLQEVEEAKPVEVTIPLPKNKNSTKRPSLDHRIATGELKI